MENMGKLEFGKEINTVGGNRRYSWEIWESGNAGKRSILWEAIEYRWEIWGSGNAGKRSILWEAIEYIVGKCGKVGMRGESQ